MVFMIKMELGDLNEIPALWQDNLTKLLSFPDKMSLKKGNVPGSGAGRMSVAVPDSPGSGQGMRQGRQCRRRKPKEYAIVKGNGGNADSRWFCASGVLGAGRFPPLAGKSFSGAQEAAFLSNTRRSAPAEAAMRDGGPHFQGRPDVKRTMEVFVNRIFAVSHPIPGHP